MKKYFLFIVCILYSYVVFSQKNFIFGTVYDANGEKINSATILENGKFVATSNIDGTYTFLTSSKDSILVAINILGYKSETKSLYFLSNVSRYELNFNLNLNPVLLNDILIEGKSLSLYEKDNWTIYDYFIDKELIFVLAKEIPKSYLYIFNLNGKLRVKKELSNEYISLFKSCIGGYHLIGSENCSEFKYLNGSISIGQSYKRQKFEDFLSPCIFRYDSIYIFKSFSDFNKKISFYYYDKNKTRKILYEIVDKESLILTVSEYKDIIKTYFKTINNDSLNINLNDNIIENYDWNGDLEDLAISTELMFMVMWFKNITLKKLNVDIFKLGDEIFVIDFDNKEIIALNNSNKENIKFQFYLEKSKIPILIADNLNFKSYFINDNYALFEISKIKNNVNVNRIFDINSGFYFPKKFTIYNNELFFINYDNVHSTYNKISKIKFD